LGDFEICTEPWPVICQRQERLLAMMWTVSHDDSRLRAIKSIINRPFMTQEL